MNNKLFWAGASFQLVQLFGLLILGIISLEWNIKILAVSLWVVLNICSLIFMLLGALMDSNKNKEEDIY